MEEMEKMQKFLCLKWSYRVVQRVMQMGIVITGKWQT